jgi:methylated-DNA-[protein]-cysteine S-methyltransferase
MNQNKTLRDKTNFEKKVYDALLLIPKGKVTTYKLLGDFIWCNSAQAIGQALTRNPDVPQVPCHRVIKTDGTIWWYAFWVSEKRSILQTEGVYFDDRDTIINPQSIYYFH